MTSIKVSKVKEWECRKVKLKDIMPNKKNPRTITKDKFERLKKKIEEVGFHSPIKVDNNGVILGGNQRYAALMDMGPETLKCRSCTHYLNSRNESARKS